MKTKTIHQRLALRGISRPALTAMLVLMFAGIVAPPAHAAQTFVVELDPAQTTISFLLVGLLHDTHGTFKLKSGKMQFDPDTGAASGSIIVDVTTGDTGDSSRDSKMHSVVLESAKFGEAVFTPKQVVGSVAQEGASQVDVQGVLRIHGTDHNVTMTMAVTASGGKITAKARFNVPYAEWGMKNPSVFLLRVADSVTVEVSTAGRLSTTP
jgi:polyisoprenoid-binding protein YceI